MTRLIKLLFIIFSIGAAAFAFSMRSYLTEPVNGLDQPQVYELRTGASLSGVAYELNSLGIIDRPRMFVAWGRFTGQASQLQAGEYDLNPGTTPMSLLEQFVSGQVKLYPFTILEGWTVRDLLVALASDEAIKQTLQGEIGSEQLVAMGVQANHPEGQFFPETYFIPRGTSDIELLSQAHDLMQNELKAAWDSRAVGLPLASPYELLTLASIIERETAVDSERPQVAGVFVRRLQKGMRLQTDPTVIYGIGDQFDGNLTRTHLKTDTPYNTYTRRGLPPTPIGLPGRGSLLAAGQPDAGEALYFVASGDPDGSHVFSTTLQEHNVAVAAYIARLKQARRARKD